MKVIPLTVIVLVFGAQAEPLYIATVDNAEVVIYFAEIDGPTRVNLEGTDCQVRVKDWSATWNCSEGKYHCSIAPQGRMVALPFPTAKAVDYQRTWDYLTRYLERLK